MLNVFHLYRPFCLGEKDDEESRLVGGNEGWDRGRWWYNLAHVCQRWRKVILGSASYLDLSLVCTRGTLVADMLAHSPPLPLIIDFVEGPDDFAAEDEEGTIFALKQRDRIYRVRFRLIPQTIVQKFIVKMDEEYPMLEYLVAVPPIDDSDIPITVLPETLRAPHLRHLALAGFAIPIGSQLLTNAVGLITLYLYMDHPSTYFHPNTLLQWLSFMPQLEAIAIQFYLAVPGRDVERQLTHMSIIAPVTLPNLRYFEFRGVSTYLEALVHRITSPRLEKFRISFFHQLTFPVPRLLQFMNTTENLRFNAAKVEFSWWRVHVEVYSRGEVEMHDLHLTVRNRHLDWQVHRGNPTFLIVPI